jgi:hypothetical protein
MVKNSAFRYHAENEPNDYANVYLKADDIFPFTLNNNGPVNIESFNPDKKSAYQATNVNVAGAYTMGADGKYHLIDPNHYKFNPARPFEPYDRPQQPGLLAIPDLKNLGFVPYGNTGTFHQVAESGKAYILAPGIEPDFFTELLIDIKPLFNRIGIKPEIFLIVFVLSLILLINILKR